MPDPQETQDQSPPTPPPSPEAPPPDPSDPPSEASPPEVDEVANKLAAAAEAAKRAKQARSQKSSLEQKQKELDDREALLRKQYDEWQSDRQKQEELRKADPLKWFESQGLGYDEITALYLNGGKLPPELELKKQLELQSAEIQKLKEERERQIREITEQRNTAVRQAAEKEFIDTAIAQHDKFPSLLRFTQQDLVTKGWAVIENAAKHFQSIGLAREKWPTYSAEEVLSALEEEERAKQAEALLNKLPKPATIEAQKTASKAIEEPPPTFGNDAAAEGASGKYQFVPLQQRLERLKSKLGS